MHYKFVKKKIGHIRDTLTYITKEGEIIKNLNKGEFYKYLGINQSNHIQHSIIIVVYLTSSCVNWGFFARVGQFKT
jgi:hypothetical protein